MGKFFEDLDEIDKILAEANMKLDNEMHQSKCEKCRHTIENHKVENTGFIWCKTYSCYVSKTTANCEKFKEKE